MKTTVKITTLTAAAASFLALTPFVCRGEVDAGIKYELKEFSGEDKSGETISGNIGIYVGNGYTSSREGDGALVSGTKLSDSTFAGATISATRTGVWIGTNAPMNGYNLATVENVDFSNMSISAESASGEAQGVIVYNSTLTDLDFSGTKINLNEGLNAGSAKYGFWLSSVKASHINFSNMQLTFLKDSGGLAVFGLSGNATQWTTLSDADFRDTQVAIYEVTTSETGKEELKTTTSKFDYTHFYISGGGCRAEIKNVILSDGEIYSTGVVVNDDNSTLYDKLAENKGLMLTSADDTLTIDGGKATLTVSCEASAGQIVLTNAAQLTIADNTALTLDGAKIVVEVADGTSSLDLSTILGFKGENSMLKISGDDIASAFVFRDADGNTLNGVSVNAGKVADHIAVIPEPSAFGLLAGAGALALAVSRRRKRA